MINPYNLRVGQLVFINTETAYEPIAATIGCAYPRNNRTYVTVNTRFQTVECDCENVYETFEDALNAKRSREQVFINECLERSAV